MLPLTNGIESTKLNIFIYSLIMIPVIVMPYAIDFVGFVFLIPSLILTFYYNFLCFELYNFKKNKFDAKKSKIYIWIFNFIFISDICSFFNR
jgi:protoheme IX farnesyltransferase